jgi:hypothetical protein
VIKRGINQLLMFIVTLAVPIIPSIATNFDPIPPDAPTSTEAVTTANQTAEFAQDTAEDTATAANGILHTPEPTPEAPKPTTPPAKSPTTPTPTTPTPAPAPDPAPTKPSYGANQLVIPALGISAGFSSAGLNHGSLIIPDNPKHLTLFSGGGQPCGTTGTVLIAGHVSYNGVAGALNRLGQLGIGAEAIVTCADGTPTRWVATRKVQTPKETLPSGIWSATGPLQLAVITCAGQVVNGSHTDNVTVFFSPVG